MQIIISDGSSGPKQGGSGCFLKTQAWTWSEAWGLKFGYLSVVITDSPSDSWHARSITNNKVALLKALHYYKPKWLFCVDTPRGHFYDFEWKAREVMNVRVLFSPLILEDPLEKLSNAWLNDFCRSQHFMDPLIFFNQCISNHIFYCH